MPQQSLQRQRLGYLCDNLISAVAAVLLGVVIVSWVLHDIIDAAILYPWMATAGLIIAFRLCSYFWIKQRLNQPENYAVIERLLIASAAATGLLWGIGSILFAMHTDMFYWVFLAFVLSGYASGSVFTTSASLPACAAYFFPTILPITVWFFLQDDPRAPLMGVLLIVFIAAAWNVARNANRMLLDKHTLFAEKAALSDSLKKSNARQQQLLDHAPIGLLVIRDGQIMYSNPYWQQRVQGGRVDEVRNIEQLIFPDDRLALDSLLGESSSEITLPVSWLRQDKTALHTEVSSLDIEFDEQPSKLLLVEDIESRLKAEAAEHLKFESKAYAQRLSALQTMAGGIAHDFNNLLAAIICNASLITKKHGAQNPELTHLIGRIENASNQATRLSHQMLAYSGHGAFALKPLDLSALISDIHAQLEALTDEHTRIHLNLDSQLPTVDADPEQIHQLLENLIINASESYHGAAGVVTISSAMFRMEQSQERVESSSNSATLEPGTYVSLHIKDSGCGMDQDTLLNIFDPFFSTKFTGRGLGMSAVFGIVRGLHGDVRIDSTPGKGTDVHILLPASRTIMPPETTSDAIIAKQQDHKKTVLFVDDEDVLREAASDMLEIMGYHVLTACDGLEALDIYTQQGSHIDIVILDLTMPKMDGTSCMQALHRINPAVCVILSSGYSMDMISAQLGDCIPAAMLQKPYSADILETTVQGLG